jgi:galactokinase
MNQFRLWYALGYVLPKALGVDTLVSGKTIDGKTGARLLE